MADRRDRLAWVAYATTFLMVWSVLAPLGARAEIGSSSTETAPLTTGAPDLRTAQVTNASTDSVRFCFDQPVTNFASSASYFSLRGYDSAHEANGTSIDDDADLDCVVVDFGNSEGAVTQYTVGTVDQGAVQNSAGTISNVQNAAALSGISLGAGGIGGKTSTADLTSAQTTTATNVAYSFDEALDHTVCNTGQFGFWTKSGTRESGTATGCTITPGSSTANVTFPDTSLAHRYFALEGAVQERGDDTGNGTNNPTSSTTQAHTATADLIDVDRVIPEDTTVDYTFDQGGATPPACNQTFFKVYQEDGTPHPASDCQVMSNSLGSLVIRADFTGTTDDFSSFETPSAAVEDGAVSGSIENTDGARPLGTSQEASGFTDAPDLEAATFGITTVTYSYDERVQTADPSKHCIVSNNAVEGICSTGSATVNDNEVVVPFTAVEIENAVGAYVQPGAVDDYGENQSVQAAVGRGPAPQPGTVQLSTSSLSVAESAGGCPGGGAQLTVTRTGGSSGPASVNYTTSSGSATQGSDYGHTSGTLNWTAGDSSSRTICVPILQDGLSEGSESFTVTLSGASGAGMGSPSSATVTILDDDVNNLGNLSFSSSSYITSEGNNATITVIRTGGSTGTVTVNYTTSNGSAQAGSDYSTSSGTLVFSPGETAESFTVPITNDSLDESDETVNLSLSSPGNGAGLNFPSTAVLTIVDNDVTAPGAISLSSATYSVSEAGGALTVTAIRTGGSLGAVAAQYVVSSGTATSGSDFTPTSGTVIFGNGDVSESFTIPITNDALDEVNETATVTLSSPSGGATIGSPSQATVTIIDDDGTPQPEPEPEDVTLVSDVSLDYGPRRDRFFGRVIVLDGSPGQNALCTRNRTVALKHNGSVIATANSGQMGHWSDRPWPDPAGVYKAVVRRKVLTLSDGTLLTCLRGESTRMRFL